MLCHPKFSTGNQGPCGPMNCFWGHHRCDGVMLQHTGECTIAKVHRAVKDRETWVCLSCRAGLCFKKQGWPLTTIVMSSKGLQQPFVIQPWIEEYIIELCTLQNQCILIAQSICAQIYIWPIDGFRYTLTPGGSSVKDLWEQKKKDYLVWWERNWTFWVELKSLCQVNTRYCLSPTIPRITKQNHKTILFASCLEPWLLLYNYICMTSL